MFPWRSQLAVAACLALACDGPRATPARPAPSGPGASAAAGAATLTTTVNTIAALDSLALEREPCFGTCPAYRLTLRSSGAVRFESRNRGDSGRVATARVAPDAVAELRWAAQDAGFLALPDEIAPPGYAASDAGGAAEALCGPWGTDHPTATVTLYMRDGRVKRVRDYQGCRWAPAALRDLERRIDAVAGTRRWVRPNRRR